jgi:DsbC/DsbD-like thiol-disulfide interchange protein
MRVIAKTLCVAFVTGSLAVSLASAARAADASAWSDDTRSALRLITGSNASGATPLRAGIEIKMQPGWHTYWRYPGDSGVPPRFDFSGSENLKSAKVLYPAPSLHSDEGGESLGYEGNVIFPVVVTAAAPGKPVQLRLKVEYAVCEKLCVPAEGRAELPLSVGTSGEDAALKTAQAKVPELVPAAAVGLSARRVNNGPKPLVMVDLTAPAGKPVQLFVEGPTPEWALPIPKPAQGAPAGHQHFAFELDGLPPGVDPKGPFDLTFTLVGGDRPLEVKTRLD